MSDTLTSVILTYPTLLIPFCGWLLIGYFRSVPHEPENAARQDGSTRLQTIFKVFIPLCTPGFITAAIFALAPAQNRFLHALVFLTPTAVRAVSAGAIVEQLAAAAPQESVPVAIICWFFAEHYVAALTAGAVKQ